MASALARLLQRNTNGQYTLTLPKQIVLLLGWKSHEILSFSFLNDAITISKTENENDLCRKLQMTNKSQFILTIPKNLIQILKWDDKQKVIFEMTNSSLVISKGGENEL